MKRQHFLVCLILLFFDYSHAQDQTNFTHFYLSPYLVNPSYAGIDGKPSITFLYRKQWATIKDGPSIGNVTFHAPLTRRISFGLSATDDQKGLLHSSGAMLSLGYNIPLSPHSFFRFGMSGGVSSNSVDLEKLDGLNDPAIGKLLNNNLSILGNAGVSFHLNTFHGGFSLPVIFQPSYISRDAFTIAKIDPFQSIIFHFSNRFYFNNDRNVFEPYAVYRMNSGLPPQFEVAGILHMNHAVWVGGSFKEDFGISALGGIKMRNTLAIGASYTLKNSGVNELNSPTYEVSLGLLLGRRKEETPMYSFVHTEKEKIRKKKKSASELIAEKRKKAEEARKEALDEAAKKRRQEEIAKKQEQINAQRAQEQARKKQEEEQKRQEALARQQQQTQQAQTVTPQQEQATTNNAAELVRKQQEERQRQEALARQQREEAARKQQEELARRQQEEAARKQQEETVRKQQEESARRQQEDLARKQQEELARKQREELARKQQEEAARKQQEELARRQREEAARREQEQLAQRQREEAQRQQEQPEEYTSTIRQDTIIVKHKPRFNHIDASMEVLNVEVTEHNEQDEKERISRLTLHAEDPDEHHDGGNHPNGERHEFVQKGSHEDELDVADYVVTGVFRDEGNAKHFVDGLKKLGFKAKYGHLTEKAVWYVYLHQGTDINEARRERDRYRKMKMFRDAWLLTVHH